MDGKDCRMNPFHTIWRWLRLLAQRRAVKQEIDEELRFHVEQRTVENITAGMSPEEAAREARKRFGNLQSVREECREKRGASFGETTWQDIRFGVRMLRKNPGFTAVAVLTLALGIGANTAIFSVINGVLLKPLPYPEPGRLVWLSERGPDGEGGGPIAFPNFADWQAQQSVFEHFGVYKWENAALTGLDEPAQLEGARVAADLLAALAVQPAIGRLFRKEEDQPGASSTVLISHALWQSRFNGSPEALGKTVSLDNQPYIIVGVMPERFAFPNSLDYWVPIGAMSADRNWQNRRNYPGLYGIARLKSGVTLAQARTELDLVATRLEQQYPESNRGRRVQIEQLHDNEVGGVRRALWTLLGAVGMVLFIACANLANLFLARSASRQKEIALRASLGASRSRILRQLLTESMLLALIGGVAGVLFARGLLRFFSAGIAAGVPRADEITLDGSVLLFSAAIALLTGILFGLAPAWRAGRICLQETLKDTALGTTRGRGRLRQTLVVAEVAVTLVLLIGAGLLLRSFHRLRTLDPGFHADRVLTFQVGLPSRKYEGADRILSFYQTLLERLRALPGVESASVSLRLPLENSTRSTTYVVEGEPVPPPHERPSMNVQVAGPDYFRTLGTPLLRGRPFTDSDDRAHWRSGGREDWASALNVIIIDEDFARKHWPNADPIGQRIRMASRDDTPWMTVVGVVPRVKWRRLDETGGLVQGYIPFLQSPLSRMRVLVKSAAEPGSLIAPVRKTVLSLDPDQPIYQVQTISDLREQTTGNRRLNVMLLGLFGVMALALAVVGLYGVLSYAVSQRRREIGVRMALGAQRRDVLGLVIGEGMRLALCGVALGLVGALALTRVLRHFLFEVKPSDPLTFAIAPLVLVAVALLACWLPARRAARVEPMEALRCE
jgi:predicted permease